MVNIFFPEIGKQEPIRWRYSLAFSSHQQKIAI